MKQSFINIHTHQESTNEEHIEIISLFHNASIPEGKLFSIGAHPWHAEKDTPQALIDEIFPKVRFAFAIGECGLDRSSSTNWDKQVELFRLQIILSEKAKKPLIIHAVKSYHDIIALHKIYQPKQAWIIHGYQGNTETMQQLTQHGIYLSYGAALLRNQSKLNECLIYTPEDKLFFETDEASIKILSVYEHAARLKNISVEALNKQIHENFAAIKR
ncbi:MAG: TatD family hydrolase [Bacteroidota bacterium]|nr:TatD family hydrolase [Bacteroidota bacterium]